MKSTPKPSWSSAAVLITLVAAISTVPCRAPVYAVGVGPASIPSYYSHEYFNVTSPSAYPSGISGYANPAVYGILPGADLSFASAVTGNNTKAYDDYATVLSYTNMGFGLVHERVEFPETGAIAAVNDWRIGIARTRRSTTLGLGFGFSSLDDDKAGRSNIVQVGLVQRFGRSVTVGACGNFATEENNQTGLFDAAYRPFRDYSLTVFADTELRKGMSASDVDWSVGARVEFLRGIHASARYFSDDMFSVMLAVSLGAGWRISGNGRFDTDGENISTTTEIRWGFREPGLFQNFDPEEERPPDTRWDQPPYAGQ